jgi:hypothetical protein
MLGAQEYALWKRVDPGIDIVQCLWLVHVLANEGIGVTTEVFSPDRANKVLERFAVVLLKRAHSHGVMIYHIA